MILKEYQKQTLAEVRGFLDELASWRDKVVAVDSTQTMDWVAPAWQDAGGANPYLPRRNGLGHPLPCFCLKIPTGGGKTLLAVKVIDLINHHFRRSRNGLVLWVVPTTQIYNQTLAALKDRDHPYRQQLDIASAGRTLVLEKTDRFRPQDVAERLGVLLLMLPSANRRTKEHLRMFHDSGGFDAFFPNEDDNARHDALLAKFPNLDVFDPAGGWNRQPKTSLGNTLRTLAPLVILDEGHKAYSANAKATLEGFNPCMIVELSATPPKGANVLVEISGQALNREEMIKLDLNIMNKASPSWQDTLLAAVEQRNGLEAKAERHDAETGDYIRPICLIQVERTGADQRAAGFIHADDARDYLLTHPGIRPEHVAVKTSERDELKELHEVGGLLSRDCPIRYIITKQALQEGWGLESKVVSQTEDSGPPSQLVATTQRRRLRNATRDLVLPAFMVKEDGKWRPVHFEEDILSRVPWGEAKVDALFDLELGTTGRRDLALRAGLEADALLEDPDAQGLPIEDGVIDYYFAASHLRDTVPNPWRAAGLARQMFDALLKKHPVEKVAANYLFVLEELRKHLDAERDRLCRGVFEGLLESGTMRFIVVTEDLGFNKLPTKIDTTMTRQANRKDGTPYQKSLFQQMDEAELNSLETKVATCLDKQARLFFWYRNRSRQDYFVQAWKPRRIYADFVLALKPDDADDEFHQVFVMETKGIHLQQSEDTKYKRSVFDICTERAKKTDWAKFVPAMQRKALHFEIVDEDEWERKLNEMLAA